MTTKLEPLQLDPVIVPKPWGGRRLATFGKPLPSSGRFGESWEVADLPPAAVTSAARSRTPVMAGALAGHTLHDLIGTYGPDLLGSASPTGEGDFPLLVKLLDASEHLSVQVHPTAGYVSRHPGARLKTESWYVMAAEPGSVIYKGFRPGVVNDDVERAAGTRAFVDLLRPVDVVPGDFHHLPAGTVHALGAGVMVAEIQTPSDTTFRLYDWTDEYGRPARAMHVEEGVAAVDLAPPGAVFVGPLAGQGSRRIVDAGPYWVREHKLDRGPVPLEMAPELRVLIVIRGSLHVSSRNWQADLPAGSTVVIPAACAEAAAAAIVDPGVVLEVGLSTI